MIGKLKGIIDTLEDDHLLLDVGGVCYLVFASNKTLARIGNIGDATQLIIETHVREDHIHLYGFANALEREWFRILTSVQGVGVRMGLAILGLFDVDALQTAIAAQDKKALTAVSGVGPKLAERIVTELKGKVASLPSNADTVIPIGAGKGDTKTKSAASGSVNEDAVSALVNLGYNRTDAFSAVARAAHSNEGAGLDDLIRLGLKELA